MDLQKIIEKCQLGEKEAFRILFASVEKKALNTAYSLCGDKHTAEDILQETYIKCFVEIKKLKNAQSFKSWFFKILVRTGWKTIKKNSKFIPMEMSGADENLFYGTLEYHNNEIEEYETRNVIEEAVNHLSENLKTVVILYYYNDFSIDDVAKITGCFKATVKSRLFYARKALKKDLISFYDDATIEKSRDKIAGECRYR